MLTTNGLLMYQIPIEYTYTKQKDQTIGLETWRDQLKCFKKSMGLGDWFENIGKLCDFFPKNFKNFKK